MRNEWNRKKRRNFREIEEIEESFGAVYEKELQGTSQKEFRIEKLIRWKGDKLYVKWKGYDNLFNNWNNMKDVIVKLSQYFPKPHKHFGRNLSIELDLPKKRKLI